MDLAADSRGKYAINTACLPFVVYIGAPCDIFAFARMQPIRLVLTSVRSHKKLPTTSISCAAPGQTVYLTHLMIRATNSAVTPPRQLENVKAQTHSGVCLKLAQKTRFVGGMCNPWPWMHAPQLSLERLAAEYFIPAEGVSRILWYAVSSAAIRLALLVLIYFSVST